MLFVLCRQCGVSSASIAAKSHVWVDHGTVRCRVVHWPVCRFYRGGIARDAKFAGGGGKAHSAAIAGGGTGGGGGRTASRHLGGAIGGVLGGMRRAPSVRGGATDAPAGDVECGRVDSALEVQQQVRRRALLSCVSFREVTMEVTKQHRLRFLYGYTRGMGLHP